MPLAAGLYYFANGETNWSRPAVILIHGAGGNHLWWPPEIRRMGRQRIYSIDLPGHGKSNGIGRQDVSEYAQSVLAFMDALKLRAAVFVGHSMGGAVALQLGLSKPSRTLGLGLIASGSRMRVAPVLIEQTANPATVQLAVKTVVGWSFSSQADDALKETACQRMLEVRSSVLHSDFLACDAFDVNNRLGHVKAPTLILSGSDDQMLPLRYAQSMHERIKGSMLHTVENGGHMLMLENPNSVARVLQLFLDGIPYQPGANDKT